MNPNNGIAFFIENVVVICFDFIIFALWIPTQVVVKVRSTKLWFASILLFLHYESQQTEWCYIFRPCCDLLRFYYFCIMNPNKRTRVPLKHLVVICFDFIIFALWIPTSWKRHTRICPLWFASILLFLHYESQLALNLWSLFWGCDLLRFYYFCIMNPNRLNEIGMYDGVVICFDFIIFALWIPTAPLRKSPAT